MVHQQISIRPEVVEDYEQVAQLHRYAFGGDTVSNLVAALRDRRANIAAISLVAQGQGGEVRGHVMLSACRLDAPTRLVDVLTLSPLSVAAEWRGQGIGGRLIRAALDAAEREHCPLVFLEGDPSHYEKHGFEAAVPLGFRRPSLRVPEPAFQVKRLASYQPWMDGTFVYSDVFWELDCVGLR